MKFKSIRAEFDADIRNKYNVSVIAGSDEAGRGSLAGPLVVASVILPVDYDNDEINDSKKISISKRLSLFFEIKKIALAYCIKIYDNFFVEEHNPKLTSIIGMKESLNELKVFPQIALIDGEKIELDEIECVQLIKGDARSQTIGAASILAKVTRDQLMDEYAIVYPGYYFESNKGYGTKLHLNAIKELGILPIHRKTYEPIKSMLKKRKD
ncbi:ribonuclease HII [Spiroplasma endosymbiont of Labia minor]|uniref:ribonuclease HII n=1 Tax=Spiroplasma endosymbiont of Labia minor TaxID=3066305 RepID=UPI0030CC9F2E